MTLSPLHLFPTTQTSSATDVPGDGVPREAKGARSTRLRGLRKTPIRDDVRRIHERQPDRRSASTRYSASGQHPERQPLRGATGTGLARDQAELRMSTEPLPPPIRVALGLLTLALALAGPQKPAPRDTEELPSAEATPHRTRPSSDRR
jgi:hypothetical protein